MPILALALALAGAPAAEAERLATRALEAAAPPAESLADARRALALTADFDPTDFVRAGRKGEVVEDEFVSARRAYRRHRALLYEAAGASQSRAGDHRAAARYLGRAVLLDPGPARVARLARALLALDRGAEALRLVLGQAGAGALSAPALALVQEAVDAAGFPSAQLEIDRVRLAAAAPAAVFRDGPFRLPAGGRLSSGAPLRLEDGRFVLYAAEASCRTCSADLQELKRAAPADVRVVLVPEAPDRDQALRQILGLYRYDWPLLIGNGAWTGLGLAPGSALIVGRGGWAGATVKPPFLPALATVLSVFGNADVRETLPRPGWNGRPVDRRPAAPPPALLPEGLAPGEDEPPPAGVGCRRRRVSGRPGRGGAAVVRGARPQGGWLAAAAGGAARSSAVPCGARTSRGGAPAALEDGRQPLPGRRGPRTGEGRVRTLRPGVFTFRP